MRCLIYDNRPAICRDFPQNAFNLAPYPKCTYYIDEEGKVAGVCSECGQCCILFKDIHNLGVDFKKGDPCPYLDTGAGPNEKSFTKKMVMFSGGLDSTYLLWKLLKERAFGVHIHHVSIRTDSNNFRRQDEAVSKIIDYFSAEGFEFEYSESKFEFFGQEKIGWDSDLVLLAAQKLALNFGPHKVELIMGWNPSDLERPSVADRSRRHVTQNLWKALVESCENRNKVDNIIKFPLIEWGIRKDTMFKELPKELLDLTWSCRQGGDLPCGSCHACLEREGALSTAL